MAVTIPWPFPHASWFAGTQRASSLHTLPYICCFQRSRKPWDDLGSGSMWLNKLRNKTYSGTVKG